MQIVNIVPTSNLQVIERQRIQMYLTHLVERDPEYKKFARKSTSYKILDNSLIELGGAVDLQRVLAAAQEIEADEIILPDVFQNGPATIERVNESLEELRQLGLLGKYKLMAVAQGRDYVEFCSCFKYLEAIPEIDVIGIPKVCAKMHPAGRPAFEGLWMHSPKKIHLLGLWYCFSEVHQYERPHLIRSVDTCQAAYLAKYHMKCTDVRPDGFTIDLQDTTIDCDEIINIIDHVGCR